jgi:hypothetical protein
MCGQNIELINQGRGGTYRDHCQEMFVFCREFSDDCGIHKNSMCASGQNDSFRLDRWHMYVVKNGIKA